MRPLIKYCGNHSYTDLERTFSSRADFIGLIFTPKSRRTVQPEQAALWIKQLAPLGSKKLVGVFADDPPEHIFSVLRSVPLDILQFHGSETPRTLAEIKKATGLQVWKAIHHAPGALEKMRTFSGIADGFIIDTQVKGQLGGTGVAFDWAAIPDYQAEARHQNASCLIAGGITPENIADLLHYDPMGIDIASGIEQDFQKDRTKIFRIEKRVWNENDQTAATGR
ncbi:phosphoribosylanthranilate isomerase [Sporolactobacillus shoreae]|nr:phosphoribosylanthranilate isomerase [Sporolactobacillus shoreae]